MWIYLLLLNCIRFDLDLFRENRLYDLVFLRIVILKLNMSTDGSNLMGFCFSNFVS